MQHEIL